MRTLLIIAAIVAVSAAAQTNLPSALTITNPAEIKAALDVRAQAQRKSVDVYKRAANSAISRCRDTNAIAKATAILVAATPVAPKTNSVAPSH